jgi:hypothetical protein
MGQACYAMLYDSRRGGFVSKVIKTRRLAKRRRDCNGELGAKQSRSRCLIGLVMPAFVAVPLLEARLIHIPYFPFRSVLLWGRPPFSSQEQDSVVRQLLDHIDVVDQGGSWAGLRSPIASRRGAVLSLATSAKIVCHLRVQLLLRLLGPAFARGASPVATSRGTPGSSAAAVSTRSGPAPSFSVPAGHGTARATAVAPGSVPVNAAACCLVVVVVDVPASTGRQRASTVTWNGDALG